MDPYQPYRTPTPRVRPDLGRDLDRFENHLRRLQIDFEKFFNGALTLPPEELRRSLQDELRRMRGLSQLSSVDQFRLNGVEARFNSYHELFHRRLRDYEEGRISATSQRIRQELDPHDGVELGETLDPRAVEALYVGLAQGSAAPKFDLHAFGKYLQSQVASIREKTGCSRVRFRLHDEAGRVRLKAKPVKAD